MPNLSVFSGDGGITKRQVTIKLNKLDDRYFINYVRKLVRELFKINPPVYKRKGENVVGIVFSRSELVNFLVSMGLKIGGKVRQQVKVPSWIEESESLIKSCLKGLFDTDGCFYLDRHFYRHKTYLNCGMNFTNRSLPVLIFSNLKNKQGEVPKWS